MKWLSKLFKSGGSGRGVIGGQHPQFLGDENMVWRVPPRSLVIALFSSLYDYGYCLWYCFNCVSNIIISVLISMSESIRRWQCATMMENLLSLNLVLCFLKKNKFGHMCESVFYRYKTKVTFFMIHVSSCTPACGYMEMVKHMNVELKGGTRVLKLDFQSCWVELLSYVSCLANKKGV